MSERPPQIVQEHCSNCGQPIKVSESICPHCGANTNKQVLRQVGTFFLAFVLMTIIPLGAFYSCFVNSLAAAADSANRKNGTIAGWWIVVMVVSFIVGLVLLVRLVTTRKKP